MKGLAERDEVRERDLGNSALCDKFRADRYRRCLNVYHMERAKRLENLLWTSGRELPAHIAEKLSKPELAYFEAFSKTIEDYSDQATECKVDISVGMTPPTQLYSEVRVLEEAGEVMLPESGIVNLHKGATLFLKTNEIEGLVQRGVVTLIE